MKDNWEQEPTECQVVASFSTLMETLGCKVGGIYYFNPVEIEREGKTWYGIRIFEDCKCKKPYGVLLAVPPGDFKNVKNRVIHLAIKK